MKENKFFRNKFRHLKFRNIHYSNLYRPVNNLLLALLSGLISLAVTLHLFKENIKGVFLNGIQLGGDGLFFGTYWKVVTKVGYFDLLSGKLTSNHFGWPAKIDFSFYPVGDLLNVLVLKTLTILNEHWRDPGILIHSFSILKAFPIAVISYLVISRISGHKYISIISSVIFATNSYNLIRSEGHFLLGLTWIVPISIYVLYILHISCMESANVRNIFYISILSLLIGISGFYYAVFTLLLIFSTGLITILNGLLGYSTKLNISRNLRNYVAAIVSIVLGLLIQIIPILLEQRKYLKLTSTADRSPTEAFIFAGNLESFFVEPVNFVLTKINRIDLVNYLNSQTSWEASQVGIVSSLFILILMIYFSLILISNLSKFNHNRTYKSLINLQDHSTKFTILLLFLSVIFYIRSPLNFTISSIFPQIRAWGRIEIFIGFLSILLLTIILGNIKSKIFKNVLIILTLIVHLSNLNIYSNTRLPSILLNELKNQKQTQISKTVSWLEDRYDKNCGILQLPINPFPEFDNPYDSNSDYDAFQMPLQTESFRWSYGAFKATQYFANYQNYVSEYPNFNRASLKNQLELGYKINPCVAIVDRSYLTVSEKVEFSEILKRDVSCWSKLPGEEFEGSARYFAFNYLEKSCQEIRTYKKSQFPSESKLPTLIYRIDTAYSNKFINKIEFFPTNTSISIRVISSVNSNLQIVFNIDHKTFDKTRGSINVCTTERGAQICKLAKRNENWEYELDMGEIKANNLRKLTFSIQNPENLQSLLWGVSTVKN
jgi:phosphoglycerol transferase